MKILAMKRAHKGFTLIELLVVIGIIAILAGVVIIAINPARQFSQARDTQRTSNVRAILDSIGQRMADNQGIFEGGTPPCAAGAIPTTSSTIATTGTLPIFDLAPCVVPTYISTMPSDPRGTSAGYYFTSVTDYNTGYKVVKNATSLRVSVYAVGEITNPIAIER